MTRYLGLCLAILLAPPLGAAPVSDQGIEAWGTAIDVAHPIETSDLKDATLILADPALDLDVPAILGLPADRWQRPESLVLRFGASNAAWWIRLELHNSGDVARELVVKLDSPRVDYLDFHLLHDGRVVEQYATGDQRLFSTRPLKTRAFAFPFTVEPDQRVQILMRLSSRDGLYPPCPLSLTERTDFFAASHRNALLWGAYYGAVMVLVIYNLLLYVSTRDHGFLLYVLYLGSFAIWAFGFLGGHGFAFLWPGQPWLNSHFDLSIPAVVHMAASALVIHHLQTWKRTPRLHRLILGLTALMQAVPLSLLALPDSSDLSPALIWITQIFIFINTLLILAYLWAGIRVLCQGYTPARFFVLAWSCLILSGVIHHLMRLPGLIPANTLTENIVNIGSVLEFTLLALALGDRFNRLRVEQLAMERRQLQLKTSYAKTLERQVQERTRKLREASERKTRALEREMRAREEQRTFLETVSHELRTPLTVIDMAAQNLDLNAMAVDSQTRARYAKILKATQRMSSLLDTYLSPQRFSVSREGVMPRVCDPRLLLEDARESACILSDSHRLTTEPGDLPETFVCDPEMTRLVLRTLADNAVKHTPPGTHVGFRGGAAGRRNRDGIWLAVVDSGPELASEVMERLFEPGFRGPDSWRQPGSGMGLPLARHMIETQGGTLEAASREGGGLSFKIWLPGGLEARQ